MEFTELDAAIDSFHTADDVPDGTDENTIDEAVGGKKESGKPAEGDGLDDEGVIKDSAKDDENGDDDGLDDSEAKTEEDEKNTNKDQTPKPKKNRFQERIDQKTRENHELRQKLEEYEAKLESIPPELPPKPDPSKYTYDKTIKGDYERAVAQYNQDIGKWEKTCESITAEHANKGKARIQREQQQYFSKIASEKSIYGDYNTAVRSLGSYQMTPELHEALLHDENNTDLFCFLGNPKNNKFAEQVFGLKGYAQARKLAELSFKLQAAKARQQAKKGTDSLPVGKPKGGKGGGGGIDFDKMSDADYRKVMGKAKAKLGKF